MKPPKKYKKLHWAVEDAIEELGLTRRERDVVRLMMLGRTGLEIADELKLSVPTVKSHRRAFFRGLNARNQIELVTMINRAALEKTTPKRRLL